MVARGHAARDLDVNELLNVAYALPRMGGMGIHQVVDARGPGGGIIGVRDANLLQ